MGIRDELRNISPQDYDRKNRKLHEKYERGGKLNEEEKIFFCHCLKFEDLPKFSFCIDEYYSRMFLFKNPMFPKELNFTKAKDVDHFNIMVKEWNNIVNQANHADHLLNIIAKETRLELKEMRKKNPVIHHAFNSDNYEAKKNTILEWSKYRYIMIQQIWFEVFHSKPYSLFLAGNEIVFDLESLIHILSRHYGAVMKPFVSDKSAFTKDILHTEIPFKLEEIFYDIDYYALYKAQPLDQISFRLNGTLYKIFCEKLNVHWRLSTLFPIENHQMENKLEKDYNEHLINNKLSVFLLKKI